MLYPRGIASLPSHLLQVVDATTFNATVGAYTETKAMPLKGLNAGRQALGVSGALSFYTQALVERLINGSYISSTLVIIITQRMI
jgi:hypothetical protein